MTARPGQPCGQLTKAGTPCGWVSGPCPYHGRARFAAPATPAPERKRAAPGAASPPDAWATPASRELRSAVEARNARDAAWALLRDAIDGMEPRAVGAATTVLRLLTALGPDDGTSADALRELVLRGRLALGLPPRDEDEWAWAEARFSEDALAEMRRWALLREADPGEDLEPFAFGDRATVEVDVPLVVESDDRG
ncbi:MAG: hypothetical protein IT303_18365 [Dehalococcoidia bacterium]|nr:hypothetical protein [Dehalococcoidia bacterium]